MARVKRETIYKPRRLSKKAQRKRLEDTHGLCKKLLKSNSKRRRDIINGISDDQLLGLCEVVNNIIIGRAPLNKKQFEKFGRHRRELEDVSNYKVPVETKRKIFNQKGGFISTLASFAVPLLTHLLARKLK